MWNFIVWIWQRYLWVDRSIPVTLGLMAFAYGSIMILVCLSYRVPGLASIVERNENTLAPIFPLLAIENDITNWLADGFSGSDIDEGTTIWWIWSFLAVALLALASLIASIGSFVAPVARRQSSDRCTSAEQRQIWTSGLLVTVVFLLFSYIGFRLYVHQFVAHHVEAFVRRSVTDEVEHPPLNFYGNAFSAYPEETIDYLVKTIDPEDPRRCLLTQAIFGRVFGGGGCTLGIDWSEYPDQLVRHCMTLTAERFDENDSPEETRRKCRELREWWDRY